MKKRYFALCIALFALPAVVFWEKPESKPKLVSCIVSMDTAYLTVLTDRKNAKNEEKLRKKLVEMCVEDDFQEIKLRTEKRGLPRRFHISVYVTKHDLECGSPYRIIQYDEEL